jgi:hypothetical protein
MNVARFLRDNRPVAAGRRVVRASGQPPLQGRMNKPGSACFYLPSGGLGGGTFGADRLRFVIDARGNRNVAAV